MRYAVNPGVREVAAPPIGETRQWLAGRRFPADKPLLDVAQAVPGYPPAAQLSAHLARCLEDPEMALYTPVPGIDALREALATAMAEQYRGAVTAHQVAITAGCNQAFCLVASTLAGPGDEVILPLPWYFNHQMWLELQGITPVGLSFDPDSGTLPDPDKARALITPRTRAITLVTPNNPTGAVYPPELVAAFFELAREHGIALILDETYKDFLPGDDPPHTLFQRPDWADTLIQLYSFSKVYCLTGYRVGSVIGAPAMLAELDKLADCVAICAPRIGQEAALYGLHHLDSWRRDKARLMAKRASALQAALGLAGLRYRLLSVGAYFAYLEHPFADQPAARVARRLVDEQNLLCLPGSAFGPGQERYLRLAFANLDAQWMPELAARLLASQ